MGKKSAKRVKRAWAASQGVKKQASSPLAASGRTRHLCHRPLIEIDHCGERLIGYIDCNRWGWKGGTELFMALPEEDLQALNNLSDACHKAEDTTP